MKVVRRCNRKTGCRIKASIAGFGAIAPVGPALTLSSESEQNSLNGLFFDALSAFPPPIQGPYHFGCGPFF